MWVRPRATILTEELNAKRVDRMDRFTARLMAKPYILYRDRRQLPDVPAVYVVVDPQYMLLYIGMTANLRDRWNEHDRAKQMEPDYRIYWRMTPSDCERQRMEVLLISALRPIWNIRDNY